MHRSLLAVLALLAVVGTVTPALAQIPMPPLAPVEGGAEQPMPGEDERPGDNEKFVVDEQPPGFQPLIPAEEPAVTPESPAVPAEPAQTLAPQTLAPKPMAEPTPAPAPISDTVSTPALPAPPVLPGPIIAALIVLGAFMAALFGVMASMMMRRSELARRRRAAALTLATELETRRQAFEAVPLPPNVEAGVFFVSAVTSLAGVDAGFRAAQGDLHLLPGKLAASVSVHYAAVRKVSDFVKGQSLSAAVRMLQANRLGGYPCPDAGAMRDAHEELTVAFRGIDKLIGQLGSQSS